MLNVGFERGGVVTRLEKRGDRFVEEPYEVYAPRVLAGIAGLKDTLEDRALPLIMLRRRSSEPVARLGRATDGEAQALRDQCALACLTHIGAVLRVYESVPGGAADTGDEPDGTTQSSVSGSNPVTSGASGDNPHE